MRSSLATSASSALCVAALAFSSGCASTPRSRGAHSPSASANGSYSARSGAAAGDRGTDDDRGDGSGSSDATSIAAPDATHDQTGLATWYGAQFAGKPTASGERFDPEGMTAAHRKLHFGTWVEVRRVSTGATVRVRINDRGPFGDSRRVIDLSHRAAKLLGILSDGSAEVTVRIVDGPGISP